MDSDGTKPLCTIIGAGPGVRLAVAKHFGSAGLRVALVSRNTDHVLRLAADLQAGGTEARGFAADAE